MVWLLYFILLFNIGCFRFVDSDADCMEFIAEKCQREGIFKTLMPLNPNKCVVACELVNTCFAVNYFLLNATCLLLNRTMPVSKLVKVTKCWYKSVRSPPKESIDNDPCYQKKCKWDEICMHNTTTHVAECHPLCKTPPTIPGAINETAEVEVGQNYTYRCKDGLFEKGDQNPTVTCQHDGSWTSTNFICVKQNWTKDRIYLNNIHESDVISNDTGIDFLSCMQQCDDKLNNCLSFFYDNHTSHCVLSSSFRRGLPSSLQSSDGLVYYTAPSASCDMEYSNVSLGGSYFCIKFHAISKTFNEAMKLCESEKAKLLVVTTKAQVADAKTFIKDTYAYGTFLGMSNETNQGRWVSWDGEAVSAEWYPGEADQYDQNCAHIYFPFDGVCSLSCNFPLRVLCHKKQF